MLCCPRHGTGMNWRRGTKPQKMEVVSPRAPEQGEVSLLLGVRVWTQTEAVFGDTSQWMIILIVSRQMNLLQGQHKVVVPGSISGAAVDSQKCPNEKTDIRPDGLCLASVAVR